MSFLAHWGDGQQVDPGIPHLCYRIQKSWTQNSLLVGLCCRVANGLNRTLHALFQDIVCGSSDP